MKFRGASSRIIISLILTGAVTGMIFTNIVDITYNDPTTSSISENPENLGEEKLWEPENQMLLKNLGTRNNIRLWTNDKMMAGIDSSNLTLNQQYPSITSDNNRSLYCVWQDFRTGDWDIYFSKSTNFGIDWGTNRLVTNPATSTGHQKYPVITINSKPMPVLYTVWQDMRNNYGDIYFSYSIDDGITWASETQINNESSLNTYQWYPAIASDPSGNIYVVWSEFSTEDHNDDLTYYSDILLSKSTNMGITWSSPKRVNDPLNIAGYTNQSKPTVALDSKGKVFVAWEDDRNGESQIFFSRSPDAGVSFSKDIQISSWQFETAAKNPEIIADENDNIFVVWEEDHYSKFDVYFTKSLNQGVIFSTPVRVNNEPNKCSPEANPEVEVDEKGNIFISWADQRLKNHIYMAYSLDNGESFAINEQVDDADNSSATSISTVTVEELERSQQILIRLFNKIYIFWTDYRNDPNPDNQIPENGDIYFDWNSTPTNRYPDRINFNSTKIIRGWNYINLSWQVSKDIDFSKYLIYKSTGEGFEPEQIYLNGTIENRYQNFLNISGLSPSTTYYFLLVVEDMGGLTNISEQFPVSTEANIPPKIGIIEPDGNLDLVDEAFEIVWWDSDPDDNATIKIFYDSNQNPNDGMKHIANISYGEDSSLDSYLWDTRNVLNGTYYVLAIISDSMNGEQYPVYSPGKVTIFHGNLDPLIILFKSPINITGVELTESVIVKFNKEIDYTTVHSDSFYVLDSKGSKVNGIISYNSSSFKLFYSPSLRWNGSEKYYVHLTTSIKDVSGVFCLDRKHSWWFETEEYIIPMGTIFGEVISNYYKEPIKGTSVTLTNCANKSKTFQTTTDISGRFIFTVTYGLYELEILAESYQDSTINDLFINQSSVEVYIELIRPVIINFTISKYKPSVGDAVEVTAGAIHPDNEKLQYIWDFGDGTIVIGQNRTHKYKKVGRYEITVTVEDDNNGYVSQSETVSVSEAKDELDIFSFVGIALVIVIVGLIIIVLTMHHVKKRRLEDARRQWEAKHKAEGDGEVEEIGEEEVEHSDRTEDIEAGHDQKITKEEPPKELKSRKSSVAKSKQKVEKGKHKRLKKGKDKGKHVKEFEKTIAKPTNSNKSAKPKPKKEKRTK